MRFAMPSKHQPSGFKYSWDIYVRLLRYLKPHRATFAFGILGMVILAATEAGIPMLLKPVLDGTFVEKDPVWLTWAPLSLILLVTIRGLSHVASSIAFASISTHIMNTLRAEMFGRLIALPTSYFQHHTSGNIASHFVYTVSQISSAGVQVLNVLVKDTLIVIGLLGYLFWLDWQLSLLTFLLLPTVALIAKVLSRRQRRLSRGLQERIGNLNHSVDEATHGHKVIKVFGGQEYEKKRFSRVAKDVRHHQFKLAVSAKIGVPLVEFFGTLVMALVIYIGTARHAEDQLTVGGFVAFFTALGLLFSPIKRLTQVTHPLQKGLAAAESIFAMIDEEKEKDVGSHVLPRDRGEIRFEGVSFRYPESDRNALGPLDLAIRPQTMTALVGPSGGGKTTLANLLPRLLDPTEGRILVDGYDTRELTLASLREQIALVSQDIVLFNDTVAGNIAYGSPATEADIRHAAEKANALDFIEAMPDGFNTLVGENGLRLSGGQRQRLAIARALLKDAPILILDEATSALDSESEHKVQEALHNLETGRTTLVIAHRLSTVQNADRILVLRDGQIAESGTHAELLAQDGLYRHLFRTQFASQDDSA